MNQEQLARQIAKILAHTKIRLPVNKDDTAVYVVDIPKASKSIAAIVEAMNVQPKYFDETLIAEYVGEYGDTLSSEDKDELFRNILGYFRSFHTRTGAYNRPTPPPAIQPSLDEKVKAAMDRFMGRGGGE